VASIAHGKKSHLRTQGGRRICLCTCPACFDQNTKDLDEMCTCPDCGCVNSDHTSTFAAAPEPEGSMTR
jgi:hypothetical protein